MPWRRKRDDDQAANDAALNDPNAGTRAKERAQSSLDEARKLWPEVREVSKSLRSLRQENGFAEQIRLAMGVREK
jgi:hypothetical protein